MDSQTLEKPEGCLEQCFKNNLRFRLYQFTRDDGSASHLVEVSAWNDWAGQGKIVSAVGGIELEPAQQLFLDLTTDFHHYDWMDGRVVMEAEADSNE